MNRALLFLLLTFALVLPAQQDDRVATTFPFEFRSGMIFLPVRLNGSPPLSFVLDTGSARMLVDRALAKTLGLKATGHGSMQGAGSGRIPVESIENVAIGLTGLDSNGYEISTTDLHPLQASLGEKVDGILGYEFFRRFVVTVDYAAKTLTITPPNAFHPDPSAQPVSIQIREKWAFVPGELVFPGAVTVQDHFLLDTGSSDAIDHPIVTKLQSSTPSQSGVGLGAPVAGATAKATSFRLGQYTVPSPTVACCGATDTTSKLIGSDVLKFFTLTIDYPNAKIWLKPNLTFPK